MSNNNFTSICLTQNESCNKRLIFKKTILALLLIITSLLSVACTGEKITEPISRTNLKLGTVVTITLYDTDDATLFDSIFERLDEVENKMSLNIPSSEINEINSNAGVQPVVVSEETFSVIQSSINYSNLSSGYFDISIGPIVELWGIGSDLAKVPNKDDIENLLPLVNYKDIILNSDDLSVYLKNKNMKIDLGAIAKGYAADEIVRLLDQNGVKKAILNLGGNIYAMGTKVNSEQWRIGIQNPFDNRGSYVGVVEIENQTVVTSGIYERFIEEDGIRYHHILSPYDGYPINNQLASVTIITPRSIDADAYSTVLFALGLDEGIKLANSNGVNVVFITQDNKIYLSNGTEDMFELVDNSFKIQTP